MTNPSKQKGTAAESAVVEYLRSHGYYWAERRALNGVYDQGDIAGINGWIIEVKSQRTYNIPAWLRELAVEVENAEKHSSYPHPLQGVLIVKPNGVGTSRVGDWWAIMPVADWLDLA
jgi:Holliday junction resolvase